MTRPRVSDEQLLTRLARVLEEVDPVPAAVTEAALAALATRRIDVELAELVADSAVDTPEVLLDSASDVRALSFASAALTMELHLRADGATLAMRGLVAGAVGEVTAETMAATREPTAQAMTAPLDNAGSFVLGGLPPGPVRLHLRAAGGGSVMTSWVSI